MKLFRQVFCIFCLVSLLGFISGCSDSDDDSDKNTNTTSTISGVASKAPLNGATISFYKITDEGKKGELLGTVKTKEDGTYEVSLNYSGPVLAIAAGGTYIDEATNKKVTLTTELRAAISDASDKIVSSITPLTELAVRDAENTGGFKPENIKASNKKLGQLLGDDDEKDITKINPFDPNDKDGDKKDILQKNYTLLLAAISQLTQNEKKDLNDIIKDIEDDLSDGTLETTGKKFKKAIEDYSSKNENTWVKEAKEETTKKVDDLAQGGFTPTGSIADAKKALVSLIKGVDEKDIEDSLSESEKADIKKERLEAFLDFMNNVPDTSEAHLINSIAIMFDIYNDSSIRTITTNLGIDNIFNENKTDSLKAGNLLKEMISAQESNQENLDGVISSIESKFSLLKEELEKISVLDDESFSFSLTGMDTVYFDKADVKIMQAISEAGLAFVNIIQAHEFKVENWDVEIDGQTYDYSKLFDESEEAQNDEMADDIFLKNNEKLLSFKEDFHSELNDAKANILNIKKYMEQANEIVYALTNKELLKRQQNAFAYGESFDKEFFDMLIKETLVSLNDLMTDSKTAFDSIETEEIPGTVSSTVIEGKAYETEEINVYKRNIYPTDFAKEQKLTVADFFLGDTPGRNIINSTSDSDFELYKEADSKKLFKENIVNVDLEEPMAAFPVPKKSIEIDGSESDWADIKLYTIPQVQASVGFAKGEGTELYTLFKLNDVSIIDENTHLHIGIWNGTREYSQDKCYGVGLDLRLENSAPVIELETTLNSSGSHTLEDLKKYGLIEYKFLADNSSVEIKINNYQAFPFTDPSIFSDVHGFMEKNVQDGGYEYINFGETIKFTAED